MIALITLIFQFAFLVFKEYLDAKKKADDAKTQFDLSQQKFTEIAEAAILKMRGDAPKDSTNLGDAWDQQEHDAHPGEHHDPN